MVAVGSSYTLMIFLTSILLGLCVGSSAFFAVEYSRRDAERMKNGIFLSLLFVTGFHWGVGGAAIATALSQYVSGLGILLYYFFGFPQLRIRKTHMRWNASVLKDIAGLSVLTCAQQSVMNFGILMVQGLVNSFGTLDHCPDIFPPLLRL